MTSKHVNQAPAPVAALVQIRQFADEAKVRGYDHRQTAVHVVRRLEAADGLWGTSSPAVGDEPITQQQAIQLWHMAGAEVHNRLSAFEWFCSGIVAAELFHKGITTDSDVPVQSKEN